ncbi:hypothetical protein ACFFF5_15750 [Lederbergia wuyishanensis]|uniref:Tetratricopeptide (TPR) repeat protein n=1 Tax=Lederbergia wuyishanensis TaxID=1347903 RepID=A0ABU0D8P9_9BACI|nr:hypothetical protein [Lederbergia wuyishanensis]MCJ8007624.1 hypothetical protein [Lederbergia wuyishanensis]MDQ0344791.1 tetratricopeptide (TPR) repeat protein [Lederbergia wuyishanensis]
MKKTFFLSLIIAFVLIGLLSSHHIPMPYVFALTFVLLFLIILAPKVYYMYFSKNIKNIERFMKNNLNQPLIAFYYGIANEEDMVVSESLEKILKRYKKTQHQAIFKTIYSLYNKDVLEMKKYINEIKPLPFQYYYEGIVLIDEGNFEKAEEYVEKIETTWMKYALKAELELKRGELEKAVICAGTALDNAKGMQKYMIYKHNNRVFT